MTEQTTARKGGVCVFAFHMIDFAIAVKPDTMKRMLKQMLMRKMLESQLKGVPTEQREAFLRAFEKNPKLFEDMAKEIQTKMKEGKDKMAAANEVMMKYQKELTEALK
jgi:hypothetical protein